jgi:hypothetical protein
MWHHAQGVIPHRQNRVKRLQAEIARAEGAIRSAKTVQVKEQAQRDGLMVG